MKLSERMLKMKEGLEIRKTDQGKIVYVIKKTGKTESLQVTQLGKE